MANPHLLTGLGAAFSIFLSAAGACASSVPSGLFAQRAAGSFLLVWAPIMISGVLAIYGCIISVILSQRITNEAMTEAQGYRNLSAGLACGSACLASGLGMSRFIHGYMHQERACSDTPNGTHSNNNNDGLQDALLSPNFNKPFAPTWRLLVVLTFMEAIGLYGLIVALFLASNQ